MTTSQFTIYTSADPQLPPSTSLFLNTGSIINILDACLVDGYGTGSYYKAGAGWTKPFANSGSGDPLQPWYGAWKQGTGSMFTLFLNNAPAASAGGATEALATGWETLSQIGPLSTQALHAGVGLGQFPTPAQLLTIGAVNWRLTQGGGTPYPIRSWIVAADAATVYLWIQPGDTANKYNHMGFGDIYSLAGPEDRWNCFIYGKGTSNTTNIAAQSDYTDVIACGPWGNGTGNQLTVAAPAHYLARTIGGVGISTTFTKKGDNTICSSAVAVSINQGVLYGVLPCPMIDNSIYMTPIWVVENAQPMLRGRLRGLYQVGHAGSNFYNGQIISGSANYSGKVFMIIRDTIVQSFWALEISPTLEFN